MDYVTISLLDYAKSVASLNPDTWILIYAKHNPFILEEITPDTGILKEDVSMGWGAGTNQEKSGVLIIVLEKIIEFLKNKYGHA